MQHPMLHRLVAIGIGTTLGSLASQTGPQYISNRTATSPPFSARRLSSLLKNWRLQVSTTDRRNPNYERLISQNSTLTKTTICFNLLDTGFYAQNLGGSMFVKPGNNLPIQQSSGHNVTATIISLTMDYAFSSVVAPDGIASSLAALSANGIKKSGEIWEIDMRIIYQVVSLANQISELPTTMMKKRIHDVLQIGGKNYDRLTNCAMRYRMVAKDTTCKPMVIHTQRKH